MKKILLIILLASPAMASFSGYTYQRVLTINPANVTSTVTNFPVLFQSSNVTLSTAAVGGHLFNPNAFDLGFYSDASCASSFALNWDSETVNTTGSAQANYWIRVPTVSSNTVTTIYLCYGNSSVTSYLGNSTATWDSNFVAVWHLADNNSGTQATDSTSNGNNATSVITSSGIHASGQIDGAYLINSNAATPSIATSSSLNIPTDLTISVWAKYSSTGDNYLFDGGAYANTYGFAYGILSAGRISYFSGAAGTWVESTSNSYNDNVLHYDVISLHASTASFYKDSVLDGTPNSEHSGASFTGNRAIGNYAGGGGGNFANGILDELRVSNIARSAGWIQDEYATESAPNTFMTIGPEIGPPSVQFL